MGCDIHIYVEIKKNDKWFSIDRLSFADKSHEEWLTERNLIPLDDDYTLRPHAPFAVNLQIYEGRNYELFSYLAGVRGHHIPNILPRGFPPDLSDEVQEIVDHDYEHTACWLSLEDLRSFKWYLQHKHEKRSLSWFFKQRGYGSKRTTMTKLKQIQKKNKLKADEVRIIFWFDS